MTAKKYLLDTNIITYLQEQTSRFHNSVKTRLSNLHDEDEVYLSVFSLYEIEYGIAISESDETKKRFAMMKEAIQGYFRVLSFSEKGSKTFGDLKAGYLKETGISKKAVKRHDIDIMLASSAIAEDAILVSNDGIFERLKKIRSDFQSENWASP